MTLASRWRPGSGRALGGLVLLVVCLSWTAGPGPAGAEQAAYLGSQACKECHEEQLERFQKFSKKAHSFTSLEKMRKGLSQDEYQKCFECHTTGYGQPGGFRSEAETPNLKNAGCEVCHGPGSLHAASQDVKDIRRRPSLKLCESCHSAERVGAFRYRPLVYGGAH